MSRLSDSLSDPKARETRLPRPAEFSPEERQILLRIAHESIHFALIHDPPPNAPASPHLAKPRGVFVTLYLQGRLRGCVGYAIAHAPLHQAVAEAARAAAFDDSRFPPVTLPEARDLKVSLSVLSPLTPIRPEDVEVGVHGLVVSLGPRRGLLLPQVPAEYGWDRENFLDQTCRKAGLPSDAWRKGASLEAFTAEVFGDELET